MCKIKNIFMHFFGNTEGICNSICDRKKNLLYYRPFFDHDTHETVSITASIRPSQTFKPNMKEKMCYNK